MKKKTKNFLMLIVFSGFFAAVGLAQEARLEKIWVDYDVTMDGNKGMLIHLKFVVYRMKNVDAAVRIMFKNKDTGEFLVDRNKSYYTNNGYVAAFRDLIINYDPGYYDNLEIFMPYREFDLFGFPGEYNISMDVDVIYADTGDLISHLTFYDFEFSQPALVNVERIWVDYNVTRGRQQGMVVHINFKVQGLKNTDSYLAIYFERNDGTPVKGRSQKFRTADGHMAAFIDMKPCCDSTVYDDLYVFVPYDELVLPPGNYNLRMHFDLHYENGDLFEHLTYYDFKFSKKR